jgi:hypothetical protein
VALRNSGRSSRPTCHHADNAWCRYRCVMGRCRMAAGDDALPADRNDGQPLSPSERAALVPQRAKVTGQATDIAFLERDSAYFADKHLG